MHKCTDIGSINILLKPKIYFSNNILLFGNFAATPLPSYEKPVESAADIIERNITLVLMPMADSWADLFASSPDPNYRGLSQRIVIAKDWDDYDKMASKVISTGMYAQIGLLPYAWPEDFKDWYRSTERLPGDYPYVGHVSNKKWPLKKVLMF